MQINKQKYTLSQVEEIIDSHIESDTNFTFVCNFELAHYIYDYLGNEYDVEADSIELSSEVDEYYVSLNFYKNDITFVCEYAKWDQAGTYKYDDGDKIDYFVFSNMSFGDIREYLSRDGCIRFCELVDEDCVDNLEVESMDDSQYDVSPECANCVGCDEHCGRGNHDEEYINEPDEDVCSECGETDCDCGLCMCDDCRSQRHDDIVNASVGKAFEKIMASEGCPNCIVDALFQMSLEMKRLGWSDHQMYIDDCNC